MKTKPPGDPILEILKKPRACDQCHTVSRLTNGLCLNCLLEGALHRDDTPSGKEDFKEVLAGVKSGDGDWEIAGHQIVQEIARGGMGVVYQAKELHSGRIVALKCVLAYQGDSDDLVARFRREAETVACLEHPNIVPIYQVGETADGFPYYTMKYAAAGSLLQARRNLFEHPRHSAAVVMKVARGVHYAHENGVLHRDLKPGNILLDSQGEPFVSDFGLARCEPGSGNLTRSLSSFGTPGYIAPEQADGPAAKLTPAADVYSLGAILFELLAGRPPFTGENVFAVIKRAAEEAAPKLRTLAAKADRELEIICARCLEREPADRYQTAAELADDLQNWLEDRPIVASAPRLWARGRRWVRRNRRLAAALVALGLVGLGSLLWQLRAQRVQAMMNESVLAMRSVVVLPFLDLDSAASDPGATEWVGTQLRRQLEMLGPAQVRTGSVAGWVKLEDVRKAAQDGRGRAVATGTVRSVQGKRRISLRLLEPANGELLFSTTLEFTPADSKPVSSAEEYARNIYKILCSSDWSEPLNARKDPGLRNQEAEEAMRAGREWMFGYTVSHFDRAIEFFNQAIAAAPDSSLAHSNLAIVATTRTHFASDEKYLEIGRDEAFKALALAPDSPDAHRALSGLYYKEGRFYDALEEQMRTMELGGPDERITMFVGRTLDVLGRPDRALKWYEISSALRARPGEIESAIGDSWSKLGEDEQAFRAYKRAIELQPGDSQGALGKCQLHLLRGEFESAREICRAYLRHHNELGQMTQIAAQTEFFAKNYHAAEELYAKLVRSDPDGGGSFYSAISYQSALGRIRQEIGSPGAGMDLLQQCLAREAAAFSRQPANSEAAYRLAAVEASLNLTQAALGHLQQAVALGWLDYRSPQRDPRFDALRFDPAFETLIDGLSAKVAELKTKNQAK